MIFTMIEIITFIISNFKFIMNNYLKSELIKHIGDWGLRIDNMVVESFKI